VLIFYKVIEVKNSVAESSLKRVNLPEVIEVKLLFLAVCRIRIRPNPKLFSPKDPDPDPKLLISDPDPAPDPDPSPFYPKLRNML
jgi:hypothetical protein